jgi:UDP-N-acetyl-D-mannosaminuronic acid transferase (WecB/TagA/CpsF family)
MSQAAKIGILGYNIYSGTRQSLENTKGVINTINPHSYVISRKDEKFREALDRKSVV